MGELYHGSSYSKLKRIEPQKSTHGTYVYATPFKELAIIFSKRCGDNLTYSLYRDNDNEPWKIVERIPNGFETMFNNEASIYTISDSTFKYINTGFSEFVSEVGVDILKEERVLEVLDELKRLEKEGLITLYVYPDRPNDIPADDSDLLNIEMNYSRRIGRKISKESFNRMIFLHPNMLDLINEQLIENGLDVFSKNDIVELFEENLIRQALNPLQEQYIESAYISISTVYPELVPQLEKKYDFINKDKNGKIEQIFDYISKSFLCIPKDIITQLKELYISDKRSFSLLREELRNDINKMISMKELYLKDTIQNINTYSN